MRRINRLAGILATILVLVFACGDMGERLPASTDSSETKWLPWPEMPDPTPPRVTVANSDSTVEIDGRLIIHNWIRSGGGSSDVKPTDWPDPGFPRGDASTLRFYSSASPSTVMVTMFSRVAPETGIRVGNDPDFSFECHPPVSDCAEIENGVVSLDILPEVFNETEYMTVFAVWPVPPKDRNDIAGQVYGNWQFFFDNRE